MKLAAGLLKHVMVPPPYKPLYVSPAINLFENNKTYQGINVPPHVLHNNKENM